MYKEYEGGLLKKIIILALIICVLLVLPINITKISSVQGDGNSKEKIITYNMSTFTKDLSYLNENDIDGRDLSLCLFQGLMKLNEKGEIETGLCNSYNKHKGGLIYTFNLRNDIYYSNGEAITAFNIADFFKTLIKEETNNYYICKLSKISNLEEYRIGKVPFSSVGIKAVSEKVLQFTLNSDDPYFLYSLTDPEFSLRSLDNSLKNIDKNYKSIIYTGPYYPKTIDENGILLYKSNYYYGRCAVMSPQLYISFDNIPERALINFNAGKVDILSGDFKSEQGNFKKDSANIEKMKILIINKNDNDEESKYLYQYIYNKYGMKELKTSLLYDCTSLNEKMSLDAFKKIESLNIIYINNAHNREYSNKILKDIKDNLKVSITSTALSIKDFEEKINKEQFTMALWDVDYSPTYQEAFYNNFSANTDLNIIKDKNYDAALKKNDFIECSRLLNKKFFVIPVCYNAREFIYSKDISGLYYTKEGNIKLDKVKMAIP